MVKSNTVDTYLKVLFKKARKRGGLTPFWGLCAARWKFQSLARVAPNLLVGGESCGRSRVINGWDVKVLRATGPEILTPVNSGSAAAISALRYLVT